MTEFKCERIINLTPHDIVIYDESGERVIATIPRSSVVARVTTIKRPSGLLRYGDAEIPLYRIEYGGVDGLPPEPEPGVCYIVSMITAEAAPSSFRGRLLVPDTSPGSVVRDEAGRIKGVRALILK